MRPASVSESESDVGSRVALGGGKPPNPDPPGSRVSKPNAGLNLGSSLGRIHTNVWGLKILQQNNSAPLTTENVSRVLVRSWTAVVTRRTR